MILTGTPMRFSPAFQDIIYSLAEADSTIIETIDIINVENSRKIGEKKLKGQTQYDINLISYVQEQAEMTPMEFQESNIINNTKRLVYSCIEYNGITVQTPHTIASKYKGEGILSNAPSRRTIGRNQQEEISIITSDDIFVDIAVKRHNSIETSVVATSKTLNSEQLITVVVNSRHIENLLNDSLNNYSEIIVKIHYNGILGNKLIYHIENCDCQTTRICWQNNYGGIDFFNFREISQDKIIATKQKIETQKEIKIVNISAQREITVNSAPKRRESAQWLAEIITAPKVWLVDDQRYIPIDIMTDNIMIESKNLNPFELKFKLIENYIQTI